MNIFRHLLATIFGNNSVPQGTSEEKARRKHWDDRKGDQRTKSCDLEKGKFVWKLSGKLGPQMLKSKKSVRANTKSEARAKFKYLLGEDKRLPIGINVVKMRG